MQVNLWEITHKSHDVSGCPARSAGRWTPPPPARKNAPVEVSMAVRRGNPARRSDRFGRGPICARRPV